MFKVVVVSCLVLYIIWMVKLILLINKYYRIRHKIIESERKNLMRLERDIQDRQKSVEYINNLILGHFKN